MDRSSDIAAIGALADPVRGELYDFIASQSDAVSREAAAAAVGVSLPKAKFHLERLVADGLLEPEYRRLSGKSGPGAGRPAKLYRRAETEFQVSLPERRYDLAGEILATAIERSADGTQIGEAIDGAARDAGLASGSRRRRDSEEDASADARTGEVGRLSSALEAMGYEPETDEGGDLVRLRNCPFDSLAKDHTQLICRANHAYVQGVVDGLCCQGAQAVLAPSDGYCCVIARFDPEDA